MPYTKEPESILREIDPHREPYRIYLLAGDEEYFTDKIEKKVVDTYLPDDEGQRDFNYLLLYGSAVSPGEVLTAARRAPFGSRYSIVVVREAQALLQGSGAKLGELLTNLTEHPVPSTILVMCFKEGKKPNRSTTAVKEAIREVALYVESPAIADYRISSYVRSLAEEHGLGLTPQAIEVVGEHVGTDVIRLDSEMEKLALALPPDRHSRVTPEEVLTYTGLNKEYSAFDLKKALARHDLPRSITIAQSLSRDSKRVPVQMIIPTLFSFFADLLTAYYAPRPLTQQSVMQYLELRAPFLVRDLMEGLKHYRPTKVVEILHALRRCDARSKGMYSEQGAPDEILTDLVLMILN